MTGRDFFLGSARDQLIEELEDALRKARNLDEQKVEFCVLDHDISYFFNYDGEDIVEPRVKTYKRHLLSDIDGVKYYLEPKNNGFTIARYNNSEQQLERLCGSLNWYYGARDGKKFFSTNEIIKFLRENISEHINEDLITSQTRKVLNIYPRSFPWFRS